MWTKIKLIRGHSFSVLNVAHCDMMDMKAYHIHWMPHLQKKIKYKNSI